MRFWVDQPLEQWIEVRKEPYHNSPWIVVIGGSVRARYTTHAEADALKTRILKAFEE